MLNFLPQKNKNQIVLEYLLRVTVSLLIIIFTSSLFLISLFAPSFFFANYKESTIKAQLDIAKQEDLKKGDDPIIFIKTVNRIAIALADNNPGASYSEIINKIVTLKNNGIHISLITVSDETSTNVRDISISGIADTRDNLTEYENSIKTDGFFDNVSFPVSDFIHDSNSDFSATLTYKNK